MSADHGSSGPKLAVAARLTRLEGALAATDWDARAEAVLGMGRLLRQGVGRGELERIGRALERAAADPKWEVRLAVARETIALRRPGLELERILGVLANDPDARVASAAQETLRRRQVESERATGSPAERGRRPAGEELAKAVLHDVTTLRFAQQGKLQALSAELAEAGLLTDQRRDMIEAAQLRGQRMIEVLELNLSLSRAAPPRLRAEPLLPLITAALDDARDAHPDLAARVTLDVDVDARLTVSTHAGQLMRALTNVVVNALEALAGRPGRVVISARPVDRERVRLVVADDGPGMKAGMLEALGRPGKTTKRRVIGGPVCGYGFANVRKALRDCRGEVDVESELGAGTRVSFLLPLPPGSGPEEL